MAWILGIIAVLALGIAGFEFYYFKRKFERTENEFKKLRAVLNKISFDIIVDKVLESSSPEVVRKRLMVLGERFLEYLRRKYDIKGVTTYMEMKKKIEEMEIPEEEKKRIIEFLDNMILIEYSSKGISSKRREKIRRILVDMVRRMGQFQQA